MDDLSQPDIIRKTIHPDRKKTLPLTGEFLFCVMYDVSASEVDRQLQEI